MRKKLLNYLILFDVFATRKKPDNYKRTTADLRALVRFSFCLFFLKNGRLCEKHCIMSGYNLFGHTDNCYQITVKPVKHIGPCVSVCIRNVALTEYRNYFLSTMAGAAFTSSRIKTTELQTQFDWPIHRRQWDEGTSKKRER